MSVGLVNKPHVDMADVDEEVLRSLLLDTGRGPSYQFYSIKVTVNKVLGVNGMRLMALWPPVQDDEKGTVTVTKTWGGSKVAKGDVVCRKVRNQPHESCTCVFS